MHTIIVGVLGRTLIIYVDMGPGAQSVDEGSIEEE